MNNTSRLKIYLILATVVIVVAGVVWFYPRSHSSKVLSAKKTAVTGQVKQPRYNATTSPPSKASAIKGVSFSTSATPHHNSSRGGILNYLSDKLKLTEEESQQLGVVYDDLHKHVCDALADTATYATNDAGSIVIETGLPADQMLAFEKESYAKIREAVGEEKWKLFDDRADIDLRSFLFGYGAGHQAYTIAGVGIGSDQVITNLPVNPSIIKFIIVQNITYDDGSGANTSATSLFTTPEDFIDFMGKMAVMALDYNQNRQK